jgi:predicted methyltransferase MtxX (methanogen marker protein 4)
VDESGVFIVNLWLFRKVSGTTAKVTVLSCGRRKDIKKSLRTRDKLVARDKVAQLLACAFSGKA